MRAWAALPWSGYRVCPAWKRGGLAGRGRLPVAVGRQEAWVETREGPTHEEKLSHHDTSPAGDQELVQFPSSVVFKFGLGAALSNLL